MGKKRRAGGPSAAPPNDRPSNDRPPNGTVRNGEIGSGIEFEWREHVGALVGVLGLAVVALRVLAVSDHSTETAFGLIRETGAVNVGLGAMIGIAPSMALLFNTFAVALISYKLFAKQYIPAWQLGSLVVFNVVLGTALPLLFGGLSALGGIIYGYLWSVDSRPVRYFMAVAFPAVLLVFAVGSPRPWFPPEQITTTDDAPFTAYVLSEQDDGDVTILRDRPREIVRIEASKITDHKICQQDTFSLTDDPIAEFIRSRPEPKYPTCP